jgi:hypothetical protein
MVALNWKTLLFSYSHVLQLSLTAHCRSIKGLSKPLKTFTLKMETVMFSEILKNREHSTQLVSES